MAVTQIHSYAGCRMRWQETAIQAEKEKHILGSIRSAMNSIIEKFHTVNGKLIEYNFANDNGKMIHAYKEYNQKMQEMEQFKNFEYGSHLTFTRINLIEKEWTLKSIWTLAYIIIR